MTVQSLIINTPYICPQQHWVQARDGTVLLALDNLANIFGKRFRELNSDEVQTLTTAYLEGDVSNQRLQEMLSLHRVDITRLLRNLVQNGFLITEGAGRGTRYFLAKSKVSDTAEEASSPVKEGNSPVNEVSSPAKEGNSPVNQANSSTHNVTSDAALLEIARSIRESGRSMPEEIETTILALCENQFLTVRQIAELLKRKPDNLRERYIAALMQRGLLGLRFSNVPNHPDQAYRKRKTT